MLLFSKCLYNSAVSKLPLTVCFAQLLAQIYSDNQHKFVPDSKAIHDVQILPTSIFQSRFKHRHVQLKNAWLLVHPPVRVYSPGKTYLPSSKKPVFIIAMAK